jgi:hypothetical protein
LNGEGRAYQGKDDNMTKEDFAAAVTIKVDGMEERDGFL